MKQTVRRARASGLPWLLLAGSSALVAAVACSDDDGGSTPTSSGGAGGEAESVSGGAAGNPSTGGSSQNTGAGAGGMSGMSGGEAGAGGEPQGPIAGEVCGECGASECQVQLEACGDNPECAPWLACVTACDSEACTSDCDQQFADAARVYNGVYACLCDSCEAECNVAQSCEKTCSDEDALPLTETAPETLAETGLFAGYVVSEEGAGGAGGAGGVGGAPSIGDGTPNHDLAPYVRGYEPKYPLWADEAVKDRYIYVPACATIDTEDMDHWDFPVGTRIWKQFTVEGQVVETRMMHRFGSGQDDWLYAAYQWDTQAPDDPAAALHVPAGVTSANGTTHDIPALGACQNCHGKLKEKVLGFGAIQLSHGGDGLTIEKLSHFGWLSQPAPDGFDVPGTPVQQAALGYLHGNCGGCHNQDTGFGAGDPNGGTPLVLRLLVGQTAYEETDTVMSSVGIVVASGQAAITGKPRIDPMMPANSAILLRMENRGSALQMPPLNTNSTKVPDTDGGIADVTAWVNSIPLPQ